MHGIGRPDRILQETDIVSVDVGVEIDGALGDTYLGTTPEEADLMGGGKADVAVVNNGIALTQILEEHPVNLFTFASEIVLPSFERMDEFALIKVK